MPFESDLPIQLKSVHVDCGRGGTNFRNPRGLVCCGRDRDRPSHWRLPLLNRIAERPAERTASGMILPHDLAGEGPTDRGATWRPTRMLRSGDVRVNGTKVQA